MNDFLKKIRSDKKFDGNRKQYPSYASQYNNPQYGSNNPQYRMDKHGGKDRRKNVNRKTSEIEGLSNILAEIVTDMKGLLESISQTNKRLAEIEERKIETEERKIAALEKIAGFLENGGEKPVAAPPATSAPATPATPAAATPAAATPAPDPATPAAAPALPVANEKESIFPSLRNRDCVTKPLRPDEDGKDIIVSIIDEMRRTGMSYGKIASELEAERISTFSGKGKWHSQTVQKICKLYSLKPAA